MLFNGKWLENCNLMLASVWIFNWNFGLSGGINYSHFCYWWWNRCMVFHLMLEAILYRFLSNVSPLTTERKKRCDNSTSNDFAETLWPYQGLKLPLYKLCKEGNCSKTYFCISRNINSMACHNEVYTKKEEKGDDGIILLTTIT